MTRPRTKLCPQCQGTGVIETKEWGRTCRVCFGCGRVIMEGPYKDPLPSIKLGVGSCDKGERGAP